MNNAPQPQSAPVSTGNSTGLRLAPMAAAIKLRLRAYGFQLQSKAKFDRWAKPQA
jgi:hypothetical protein